VRVAGGPCTGLDWRWGYGWPDCGEDIEFQQVRFGLQTILSRLDLTGNAVLEPYRSWCTATGAAPTHHPDISNVKRSSRHSECDTNHILRSVHLTLLP